MLPWWKRLKKHISILNAQPESCYAPDGDDRAQTAPLSTHWRQRTRELSQNKYNSVQNVVYEYTPDKIAAIAAREVEPISTPLPSKDTPLQPVKPDAFVKYLSYEAACQACLRGMKTSNEQARVYLQHNCNRLRTLLRISSFMTFGSAPILESTKDLNPDGKILVVSARQIRVPDTNNNVGDALSQENTSARQKDVQLKYKDDMIMSPCSSDGHCYQFPRDLIVYLTSDCTKSDALTVCYLEDGRIVAQGSIMIKHLVEIVEKQQPDVLDNNEICQESHTDAQSSQDSERYPVAESSSWRQSSVPSGKWVELTDKDGKARHLSLSLKIIDSKEIAVHTKMKSAELRFEENTRAGDNNTSVNRLSKFQAFQYLVHCVLDEEQGTNADLVISNLGQWLLKAFSTAFDIPEVYQQLMHLDWIFRSGSANVTERCMNAILRMFTIVHKERTKLEHAAATLRSVCSMIEALCGRVLENYFRLGDEFEGGICETNWCSAHIPCPPSALHPTVMLLALLAEVHHLQDLAHFYEEKLQAAALMKFQRIKENCRAEEIPATSGLDKESSTNSDEQRNNNKQDSSNSGTNLQKILHEPEDIFLVIKRICQALTQDLEKDFAIQAAHILPDFIQVSLITARVYAQELKHQVLLSMETVPPEYPSPAVVDAFLAVGAFDEYLCTKVAPQDSGIDLSIYPIDIFSHFIDDWLHASLVTLCRTSETALTQRHLFDLDHVGDSVPLLLKNMLQMLHGEIALYQRIVECWTCFARSLEKVICDTLRHVMNIISHECKMFRLQNDVANEFSPLHRKQDTSTSRNGSTCWEWEGISHGNSEPTESLMTQTQVLLFHSLHRLMVEVPHFEELVIKWTQSTCGDDGVGCECGLFAQELRSQFTAAIVFSSRRLMQAFSINCHVDFAQLVIHIDASYENGATEGDIQECTASHFECIRTGLVEIHEHIDDRVFVSLTRGLWDCISKELFLIVVDLKEHHDNKAWKSRTHCSILASMCNTFFKNLLTDLFPHTLTDSDTHPPMHARKTQEMLAKNTKWLNNGFSVY